MVTQEPTTVEPEVVSEGIPKSPSWTPSYSSTIQGATPLFESQTILKDDSDPVSSEAVASGDVPNTTKDMDHVSAPAEPVVALEVPEPTVVDESPADDAPSEEPLEVFDPSLGQAHLIQSVEVETERPKSPWTPSYTVTTLPDSGSSPRVDSKPELDERPAVEAEAEVPLVEKVGAAETPMIVTPADEELPGPATTTETPWAQSYSVTSQPGSPRISPKAELEELESEPQPIEPTQETPVAVPIVELASVPKTVVTPAVEDEGEHVTEPAEPVPEGESKPVWTQSYSVISQPGSPRVSPKQVAEELPEAEGKPTWTRSYSVTSQPGSPRVLPKEDLPEPAVEPIAATDEPTVVVTPPVEDATPAPAEVDVPERPKSPRTSSYSVTTLEGQTEQAPPQDAKPEPEVVPIPTLIGEAPEPKPEVDAPVTDVPSSEPLPVEGEQPERPKSPWTPSYSVTTLLGSAPIKESEPAPEPVEATKVVEDQQKENGTTSDVFEVHEAVARLSVHDEPQVYVETPGPAPPQLDLVSYTLGLSSDSFRSDNRIQPKPDVTTGVEEKSSWTPSYSVTQLPGVSPKVEMKEELPASQDTPTVDEPLAKEAEYTSPPGPAADGTTTEVNKDDGSLYFPEVPESLDDAPER